MEVKPAYKHTKVGVIPEEWNLIEFHTLGSVIDGDRGGNYPSSKDFSDSNHCLFLNAGNVTKGGFRFAECAFITRDKDDQLSKGKLKRNDIVLTTRGTVGNFAYFNAGVPFEHIRINSGMVILRNESSALDTNFLFALLQSPLVRMQIERLSFGSAQPQLTVNAISKLGIVVPSLPEQCAIAATLKDVDALIDSIDQLITKNRNLKQGAMQELLTGKQRLPGFSGEWEETTLAQIGECIIGLTYKPENVVEHGLLVLRSSNVQSGRLSYADNVYVNIVVPENLITRLGDILICVRNGSKALIGKCARIDEAAAGLTFGAFMSIYRTKHSQYIFHVFQANEIQRQIHENIGATINQITNKDLNAFRVKLPPDDEQEGISTVLSDMDAEIVALEQKRDKTIALKQGMMQELLTGRIRLV